MRNIKYVTHNGKTQRIITHLYSPPLLGFLALLAHSFGFMAHRFCSHNLDHF